MTRQSRSIATRTPPNTASAGTRHFYASQLLEAGESVATVAERLGHGNAGVTMRVYAHMIKKDDDSTRKAMDKLFGGSLGLNTDQDRQAGS